MNETGRWVDPRVELVHLAGLQSYLLSHGWERKLYPQPQTLLFEQTVQDGEEPLVQLLPATEQVRDFRRFVVDVITSVSAVEERHPAEILNEILSSDSNTAGRDEWCAWQGADAPEHRIAGRR
jgi:hypothetical protein